ncbi:hypothetical protein V7122_24370, partial [Bacillus sp. JJ1532]|uniref:hypothetical protein n=1 Tax=unclassified Bacillus (in: firmicutes) TaxID=185979 RepID=UPI002FFE17CC
QLTISGNEAEINCRCLMSLFALPHTVRRKPPLIEVSLYRQIALYYDGTTQEMSEFALSQEILITN